MLPLLGPFSKSHYVHALLVEELEVSAEVEDVELHRAVWSGIGDPKVEPERVALGVCVHLHEQVVFILLYKVSRIKIAAFEV